VLEHTNSSTIENMEEIWRVCKPNALVEIHVPHWQNIHALGNPEHKRVFCFGTFRWFEHGLQCDMGKLQPSQEVRCRFKIIKTEFRYRETENPVPLQPRWISRMPIKIINFFANKFPDTFDRFWGFWVGGCDEIVVVMLALKD
jgi:hypothetical protein